jgi:hypothetical protein
VLYWGISIWIIVRGGGGVDNMSGLELTRNAF